MELTKRKIEGETTSTRSWWNDAGYNIQWHGPSDDRSLWSRGVKSVFNNDSIVVGRYDTEWLLQPKEIAKPEVEGNLPELSYTELPDGHLLPKTFGLTWTMPLPKGWCTLGHQYECSISFRIHMDKYWERGQYKPPTLQTLDFNGFSVVRKVNWINPVEVARQWVWSCDLDARTEISSIWPNPHIVLRFETQIFGDPPAIDTLYGFDLSGSFQIAALVLAGRFVRTRSEDAELPDTACSSHPSVSVISEADLESLTSDSDSGDPGE